MPTLIRVVAAVFTALGTSIVCQIAFSLVPGALNVPWLLSIAALACALLAGRYVWRLAAAPPSGLVSHAALGAITTGAIGFAIGFVGPMIFAPGANQGPLLGIFITGPLGLVLGAVGGIIYWLKRGQYVPGR